MDVNQKAAVEADSEVPLIIFAGPGSGKTATVLNRILFIRATRRAEDNSGPPPCLVLTFSTNAARELKERLWDKGGTMSGMSVETFHGFGYRVIKQHFDRLGYKQSPVLCPAKNATKILCNVLLGTDKPGSKENSEQVQGAMKIFKAAKVRDFWSLA